MKTAKILFILNVVGCLLISCERPRTCYTREDFIGRTMELATFLTDNYKETLSSHIHYVEIDGVWTIASDSVVFKTETGDTIPFYVTTNYIYERVYEYAWDEGDPFETIHKGFSLYTELETIDEKQFISIDVNHGPPTPYMKDCWTETFAYLRSSNGKPMYDIETDTEAEYEWKETKDSIFICNANMTCTLKKNVGIVKFTCDEHSWVLIEN